MASTIFVLLLSSWLVFAFCTVLTLVFFTKNKEMSVSTNLLIFSAGLFVSIFLLRLATGVYINNTLIAGVSDAGFIDSIGDNSVMLHWGESVVRSLVQTLRTFAVDEDYNLFVVVARSMKQGIFSSYPWVTQIYRIHAAIVTVLAPVAGGAIIFDILTKIFPRMKLRLLPFWDEFYVFSQLNESSFALAQSIMNNYKSAKEKGEKNIVSSRLLDEDLYFDFAKDNDSKASVSKKAKRKIKKPVFIFASVNTDCECEEAVKLLSGAKAMGAFCMDEDIAHIKVRGFLRKLLGTRLNFLIMNENQENNLHTMSLLSQSDAEECLLDSNVYLFSNSPSANELVGRISTKLKNEYGADNRKLPVFRVIDGYKNLVYNLLSDVPLYEPLVGRNLREGEKDRTLNVTVIGSGLIGMQMFLATYWMGQMLDVNLFINVVSQESEESFRNRVNLINADILKTEASTASSELLSIYCNSDEQAKPYFTLRYKQADVMTGNLYDALRARFDGDKFALCDSDYFVVAIGSDENNIFVANKIGQYIGRDLLTDRTNRRAVINYVVFDKGVCTTLNLQQNNKKVYMNAFGNFADVYNYENVFMSKAYGTAMELNETYIKRISEDKVYGKKEMTRFVDDEYGYWSSIARGLHIPYKYFSAGAITKSKVFDGANNASESPEVFNNYLRLVCSELVSKTDNLPSQEERRNLYYRLIWLEHRRWNAFIRTGGFTLPTKSQLDAFAFAGKNKTKELSLKLHPCLVECDEYAPKIECEAGMPAEISKDANLDLARIKAENFDRLDAVSLYLHKLAIERASGKCCIYKAYDSPYELDAENKTLKIQ